MKLVIVDLRKTTEAKLMANKLLTSKDKEMLAKFQVEKVRMQKAASCILKNKYIGEYEVNEFGKPLSKRYYFSVSHSEDFVVLAISNNHPLGVDIELIKHYKDEVAKFVCNEDEYKEIKDEESFAKVWTNKEALSKCAGTGLATPVKELPALPFEGKKEYKGETYFSKQLRLENYLVSIVSENNKEFEVLEENIEL